MAAPLLRVELVPIFEDNYVFILINEDAKNCIVVDPGSAREVASYIRENGLTLLGVLLTHHHNDHIGGVKELVAEFPAPVYAPLKNKNQIPFAQHYVQDKDSVTLGVFSFEVSELPGHTLGHVAFWNAQKKWLFAGDVLFGLGCGRIFEGTYEQAYHSLQRLKSFPNDSLVFCAHEYTEQNMVFCHMLSTNDDSPLTGDDEDLELYANELSNKRSLAIPSVPLKLGIEKKVNPFLLANSVAQFTYLRELRNKQ